ncbi:hypothetical protein [Streptacidiphilus sp. EB103A]|uniref:hypothetical protein n=1 Tax=Streptacidiphilus sp. EB103A TaxID=3156275 RepID=UPI0035158D52
MSPPDPHRDEDLKSRDRSQLIHIELLEYHAHYPATALDTAAAKDRFASPPDKPRPVAQWTAPQLGVHSLPENRRFCDDVRCGCRERSVRLRARLARVRIEPDRHGTRLQRRYGTGQRLSQPSGTLLLQYPVGPVRDLDEIGSALSMLVREE